MKSVLIISHGSRSQKTIDEVQVLVNKLTRINPDIIFEYGFLELQHPSINGGIDLCIERGASHVLVLLNFLNSGRHVNCDIPEIVDRSRAKHPNIPITISSPVGQHDGIVHVFNDLIQQNHGQT